MMNGQSFLVIILLIGVFAFVCINNGFLQSTGSYIESSGAFYCDNCSDCTDALNNNSYDTVYLDNDVILSHPGASPGPDFVGLCLNSSVANFSNKIFDCQNHEISTTSIGSGSLWAAIHVINKTNITIRNCEFNKVDAGIVFENVSDSIITNLITDNVMIPVYISGYNFGESRNITINDNVFTDSRNYAIATDNSRDINIINNEIQGIIDDGINAIRLDYIDNANISGNIIRDVYFQYIYLYESGTIYLGDVNNSVVENNVIENSTGLGILLKNVNTINVQNNNISSEYTGITMSDSENNTFINNRIEFNQTYGVNIIDSYGNVFNDTILFDSGLAGIYTEGGSNNSFFNFSINEQSFPYIYGQNFNLEIPVSAPSGSPIGHWPILGQYIKVDDTDALSFVNISIGYSDIDVDLFNESTLGIYRYNGTAWENSSILASGLNEDEDYVYGNLTEFSTFGVFGVYDSNVSDLKITAFLYENLVEYQPFVIRVLVRNDGLTTAENITLNTTINGLTFFTNLTDINPDEETIFYQDVPGLNAGTYAAELTVFTDTLEYNTENNVDDVNVTVEEVSSGGWNPVIGGPGDTPPQTFPTVPTIFTNFPTHRVSFSNCSLEDRVIEIPNTGSSIVLSGDLDENGNPLPGTTAILLYPLKTNQTYLKRIRCIEPQEYAIVSCDQTILASYEVDIVSDTTYFCMNYEGYDVEPETISIQSAETGEWLELSNVWQDKNTSILCANITAHTPYMVSGFISNADSEKAKAAIDDARTKIEDAKAAGIDTLQMQYFLNEALNSYKRCDWQAAANTASVAGSVFFGGDIIMILSALLFLAIVAYAWINA